MAWLRYDNYALRQFNGNAVDHDTDTIKIMVATSAYVPDRAANVFRSSVTNEVSGTNYPAGGVTLTNKTVTLAGGAVKIDADDVTILQSAGGFADGRRLIMYKDTGNPATDPLISFHSELADFGNTVDNLIFQFDIAGLLISPLPS